jgi:phosphatidylcholine synthase
LALPAKPQAVSFAPLAEGKLVRTVLAWCVHAYTALGLVAAAGIAVAVIDARPEAFRLAFILMVLATLIDATDGTFARLVRVKVVLPGFDGRRLDDLIDFQTYTTLPLLLIYQARILPPPSEPWLLLPLLASAYGFSQTWAKTSDGYFLGFPSYWNVIAFYLYVLRPAPAVSVALLAGFALLTFVPLRYLYATQRGRWNRLTNPLGALWILHLGWVVWNLPLTQPPDEPVRQLALSSLWFPAYYLVASWIISFAHWRRSRQPAERRASFPDDLAHGERLDGPG